MKISFTVLYLGQYVRIREPIRECCLCIPYSQAGRQPSYLEFIGHAGANNNIGYLSMLRQKSTDLTLEGCKCPL